MKILHVLTWVAPDNPFGGPVTVAVNTTEELRRRGHHVELVAARPPAKPGARQFQSASFTRLFTGVRLLPWAGFSGIVSPRLLFWIARNAHRFDIVHVHLCRDLVSLPSARIAEKRGTKVVLQTHGMVDGSTRRSAALIDFLLTRPVVRDCTAILVLTGDEAAAVSQAVDVPASRLVVVPNGVPLGRKLRPTDFGASHP